MTRWILLFTTFFLNSSFAFAQTENPNPEDHRLRGIFEFEEKLKTAVCDETAVSRPPALTSLSDKILADNTPYFLTLNSLPESDLISYLLGDKSAGSRVRSFVSEKFEHLYSENKTVDASALRRRISLEVCERMVDREKRLNFWNDSKDYALELSLTKPSTAYAVVFDSEGRMAARAGKVYAAGWIEPLEIRSAHLRYDYTRMVHPITGNPIALEVLSADGLPIGQLQLMGAQDSSSAKSSVKSSIKMFEAYRNKIEFLAMEQLPKLKTPASRDELGRVLSFYRNLVQAYQAMPEASQFRDYVAKSSKWPRTPVSAEFIDAVANARVGSARVEFVAYPKNNALQAIYLEFEGKLKSLH